MHCPSGSQTGCTPQPCSSSQPFVCTLTHEENHVWQTSKAAQQSDKQPSQPGQEACPVGTRSPWMQQLPCSRLALAQFLASPSLFPTTGGSVTIAFAPGHAEVDRPFLNCCFVWSSTFTSLFFTVVSVFFAHVPIAQNKETRAEPRTTCSALSTRQQNARRVPTREGKT